MSIIEHKAGHTSSMICFIHSSLDARNCDLHFHSPQFEHHPPMGFVVPTQSEVMDCRRYQWRSRRRCK